MGTEHDNEYRWGVSWTSPYIVSAIDRIILTRDLRGREILAKNYINMILAPLVLKNVPTETLEHLNLELVRPKNEEELPENADESLRPILEILTAEFGHEVTRRINLSISQEKVRTLPR